MSSEEVAELAEAINSHADVLYESWTKGTTRPDVMRRMEDTLELLADPGLTPKLEHLVSNFVKRDKEKRQQHGGSNPVLKPAESTSAPGSAVGRIRSPSPRLEQGSPFVPTASKKPLPKSILAVVQRFEPAPTSEIIPPAQARSPSPSFANLPGIGPVSKNIIRSEATLRQNVSEQNYGFHQHPSSFSNETSSGTRTNHSPGRSSPTSLQQKNSYYRNSPTPVEAVMGQTRERHIPIERVEEDRPVSKVVLRSVPFEPTARNRTNVQNNNFNQAQQVNVNVSDGIQTKVIGSKAQGIEELEREEERLVRALRTGQVIPSENYINSAGSLELFREKTGANNQNNNHSRVAFAKERIRHSQEHPLTQQRLELQRRLPAPSSNLAAAIAVQQGKAKFQPGEGETHFQNGTTHYSEPPPPYQEKENATNGGGVGRQSWVNTMLRFGSGSSVADRVQQFEKYPSHMVGTSSLPTSSSPHVEHQFSRQHSSQYPSNVANNITTHSPREITHTIRKLNTHHVSPPILSERTYNSNAGNQSAKRETSEHETYSTPAPWRIQNHFQSQKPDVLSGLKSKSRTSTALSPRTPSHEISNKGVSVPRFYWPEGKPPPTPFFHDSISKAEAEFNKLATPLIYEDFGNLLKAIGISLYWKRPFWNALGMNTDDKLTFTDFKRFYGPLTSSCPDEESRFLRILSIASKKAAIQSQNNNNSNPVGELIRTLSGNDFSQSLSRIELVMADFVPMIQDIIETHPGLGFLREAPEFHSRYMTTVISRIYYKVNRSWTGRITLSELRRSNLLRVIKRLEEETDVNAITEYFSYEHFYVIYCKFWELDKDHDLLIDKKDLAAHSENALSSRIIDRIFSGTVIRGWDIASPASIPGKMTYSDFVWFLISEEDKKSPTAIEYWFRCLDLDGDGILTAYELQHFYSEQEARIECLGIEPLDFSNVYCQMIDMLRCSSKGVRLKDLKRNPQLAANFFNTLFNLDKYLDHEQRDPFAAAGYTPTGGSEFANEGESDWDKFAAAEYELLIAEENPNEHMHDVSDFEDGVVIN